MNRIARVAGLPLLVLLAMTSSVAAQENVTGHWTLSLESPQGPADIMAVFVQDGTTVTGELELAIVESVEMSEGKMEGNKLTFLLSVSVDGQYFTVEVEAEVDGDTMEGSLYMAEMGSFPMTGKRTEG